MSKRSEEVLRFCVLSTQPLHLHSFVLCTFFDVLSLKRQEEMAEAEVQVYAKVLNKYKNRSTQTLLEPLLAAGFPAHTA